MYGHSSLQKLLECVSYSGNKPIEFVNSFCHLGHLINSELSDDQDITKGRDNFIGQVNNTLSYFRSLDSLMQHKVFESYCTMSSNFLSLNPSKTEFFIFGLPQHLSELNNPTIHLPNNVILSPLDSARNLGVIFDKKICYLRNISPLFLNHASSIFVTYS